MEALRSVELTDTNCSIGLISRNSCVVVNAPYGLRSETSQNKFLIICGFLLIGFLKLLAFADPVVMAGVPHPIPSRTRSLSPLALMVLRLKARESKSLPGQLKLVIFITDVFPYRLPDWFGPATQTGGQDEPALCRFCRFWRSFLTVSTLTRDGAVR